MELAEVGKWEEMKRGREIKLWIPLKKEAFLSPYVYQFLFYVFMLLDDVKQIYFGCYWTEWVLEIFILCHFSCAIGLR